jgi:hypothetical protein
VVEVLIKQFSGFEEGDFDAFRPEKWLSNLFNRERMLLTQKLSALGTVLLEQLTADGPRLEHGTSDDRPSFRNGNRVDHQLLYLLRQAHDRERLGPLLEKRRPLSMITLDPAMHHQHVYLGVRIDLAGIQLGLFLHGQAFADLENLRRLLADPQSTAVLVERLHQLGDGWQTVLPDGQELPCASVHPETLPEQLAGLANLTGCWAIRQTLPRDEGAQLGETFPQLAAQRLRSLLPLLQLIAWSDENDRTDLGAQLRREADLRAEAEAKALEEARRQAEERQRRQEEAQARAAEEEADRRILYLRHRRPLERSERPAEQGPESGPRRPAAPAPAEAQAPDGAPRDPLATSTRPDEGQRGPDAGRDGRDGVRPGREPGRGPAAPRSTPDTRPFAERRERPDDGRPPRDRGGGEGHAPRREEPRPPMSPDRRPYRDDRPSDRSDRHQGRDDRPPGHDDRRPDRDDRCRGDDRRPRDRGPAPERAEPRPSRPPASSFAVGELVRLERGLMAGKEGQVEAVDAQSGLLTVTVRGLKVRVAPSEVKGLKKTSS